MMSEQPDQRRINRPGARNHEPGRQRERYLIRKFFCPYTEIDAFSRLQARPVLLTGPGTFDSVSSIAAILMWSDHQRFDNTKAM